MPLRPHNPLRSLINNLFAGLDKNPFSGIAGLAALQVVGGVVDGLVLADAGDGRHIGSGLNADFGGAGPGVAVDFALGHELDVAGSSGSL